jgi:hypothetical protein
MAHLQPYIEIDASSNSPYGVSSLPILHRSAGALSLEQSIGELYRPKYKESAEYRLMVNGETLHTQSLLQYTTLKAPTTVRGVLATPELYFTDRLATSVHETNYRTARVVYMLLDEDYRPNVQSTSFTLSVSGVTNTNGCVSTESMLQHTCSLQLSTDDFPLEDENRTLSLQAGGLLFNDSIVLKARPAWSSSGHCGNGVLCSESIMVYAIGPAGPIQANSEFYVNLYVNHSTSIRGIRFRLWYNSTIVRYVRIDELSGGEFIHQEGQEEVSTYKNGGWMQRDVMFLPLNSGAATPQSQS